ncbi:hypothetical protein COCC4DRAFT_34502 [Bipolaris maydis ATCC 48331]|uniref:Uncharacterized protein n=2 Tax=Cochliobolus heterostrophus TaxID=5016 RepID=M2TUC2_COCH5|nr:uncharacterized protein COCC4DRAFT_34502 [Bipolaris maydis ATCC 48331]EMD85331.1 hypothetical protein COCHEDRAFT_1024548 [Bipolaris maydis C5]ENI00166.1 hypothetical protein COCC4DRAFT_34502 [Bipolaris maydis ATCC 48331]
MKTPIFANKPERRKIEISIAQTQTTEAPQNDCAVNFPRARLPAPIHYSSLGLIIPTATMPALTQSRSLSARLAAAPDSCSTPGHGESEVLGYGFVLAPHSICT